MQSKPPCAAAAAPPPPPSSSSSSSPRGHNSKCCHKVAEFVCGACLLCVCCPLAILWRVVKAPCKIGWRIVQRAKRSDACSCCGSEKMDLEGYSSFSDIASEVETYRGHTGLKVPPSDEGAL
ncbi:hypothetical protein RJ639_024180 [Escallonia herrerae]|uniref:Uncharacterized protein n=1 Tax=Escallonia herrerae TaxID=1293975 RepID=A0AA88UZN5_9ASTE|nr:hypothetical protein RJ639_024180 [Escallonia herrerae]